MIVYINIFASGLIIWRKFKNRIQFNICHCRNISIANSGLEGDLGFKIGVLPCGNVVGTINADE